MRVAVTIRPMRPGDSSELGFVTQTWFRSSLRSRFAELMPRETYVQEEGRLVSALAPVVRVLVAEADAARGELAGWVAYAPPTTLHYCYVKHPYRRLGIGRMLLERASHCTEASHWTRKADECGQLFSRFRFNPFAMWRV